jgi:hypothetical protein
MNKLILKKEKNIFIYKNGIFPILKGGLGNQIFIIVAAYCTYRTLNCNLYIFQNHYQIHNKLKNNYTESIFKYFGKHINKNQNDKSFIKILMENGYKYHNLNINAFGSWETNKVTINTLMNNYYQYYPIMEPYKTDIQDLLIKGLFEYRKIISSNFNCLDNSIFIHIRRGDYLKLPDYHYNQQISYYENCYNQYILKKDNISNVFILSDDINWVKEQPFFQNIPNKIFYEDINELNCLALMSLCTRGAICANSTFSWWGAFIGAYKFNNPVFVPNMWCNENIDCLFPSEWIKI